MFLSPHKESYENFLNHTLGERFRKWLQTELENLRKRGIVYFEPNVKTYGTEIQKSSVSEEFCKKAGLDYSYDIFLKLSLTDTQGVKKFYLGRIPILRENGSFIVNGNERVIVAQLTGASGLFVLSRIVKGEMHYVVEFRPEKGVWIRFELPLRWKELMEEKKRDSFTSFPIKAYICKSVVFGNLLRSMGFTKEDITELFKDLDIFKDVFEKTEQNIFWTEDYSRLNNHRCTPSYIWEQLIWRKETGNLTNEEILSMSDSERRAFNEKKLLSENLLGELGRWQTNRKLIRLPGNERYNESNLTLTKMDVLHALRYLMLQASDTENKLAIDDPWDLSNLKCCLLGDVLESHTMSFFYSLRFRLNNKIKQYQYKERQDHYSGDADSIYRILEETNKSMVNTADDDNVSDENKEDGIVKETLFTKFTKEIKRFFTTSELTRMILDDNMLTAVSLTRRITFEKHIKQEYSRQPRQVHWSHYGRICPFDTQQSDDIGTTLSLTPYAKINHIGIITTPYYKVNWNGGICKIADRMEYLTPHEEEVLFNKNGKKLWIAFADQKDKLIHKKKVFAHRGGERCAEVEYHEIAYIDVAMDQQLGFAAKLIPFIQHNDGVRVAIACNMMKQALPLKMIEAPFISTGFEKEIVSEGGFGLGNVKDASMTYGVNALTMYIPWKGYNFEDAIVISESARNKLTSVEKYKKRFQIICRILGAKEDKERQGKLSKRKETNPSFFSRYDDNDIIKEGSVVRAGDLLVLRPNSTKKAVGNWCASFLNNSIRTFFDHKYSLKQNNEGTVKKVEVIKLNKEDVVYIEIERVRVPQAGDKLANRHGHKGVISKILPDHEMPYFIDPICGHDHKVLNNPEHSQYEEKRHSHAEILINPLGVISRMNIGQLYETHWGWTIFRSDETERVIPSFKNEPKEELKERLSGTLKGFETNKEFKVKAYDPTGQVTIDSKVLVGYSYFMRLNHNAEDKEHARDKEKTSYSYLTEQPLEGRAKKGGQRFGEMEVWALMAHNTPSLLQEIMTLKSDNPDGRQKLYELLLEILPDDEEVKSSLPDAFYTFSVFCVCLGIKPVFYNKSNTPFSLLDKVYINQNISPEDIKGVEFQILSEKDVKEWSYGVIDDTKIGNKYSKRGIFSQRVFGPVEDYTCDCGNYRDPTKTISVCDKCGTPFIEKRMRRKRIGHIELSHPVVNILFFPYVALLLGLNENELISILKNTPRFNFRTEEEAELFLKITYSASEDFKKTSLQKTGKNELEDILKDLGEKPNFSSEIGGFIREIIEQGSITGIKLIADVLCHISKHLNDILIEVNSITENLSCSEVKSDEKKLERVRQRYVLIQYLINQGQSPEDFLVKSLPVIPPALRPLYPLDNNKYAVEDLNEHYINIIRQNNRLKNFLKTASKSTLIEIRRLQEFVNAFIWNEKSWNAYPRGKKLLKSVTTFFEGKEGFFRKNLLGKRIDYSARAVIVPDPDGLHINQCGLSFKTMTKLFKPIMAKKLLNIIISSDKNLSTNSMMEKIDDLLYKYPYFDNKDKKYLEMIEQLIKDLSKQYPVILNRQPTLHRLNMLAFYPGLIEGSVFAIHPLITTGYNADFDGDQMAAYLPVTSSGRNDVLRLLASNNIFKPANGRLSLNISQDIALGMYYLTLNEEGQKKFKELFGKEINTTLNKKELQVVMEELMSELDDGEKRIKTIEILKKEAFSQSTKSGVSYSIFDFFNLSDTAKEKKLEVWNTLELMHVNNPLRLTLISKARGDEDILKQLAGNNKEYGNLVDGRDVGRFFATSFSSRENLVETKLGTAEAGGMTKRLVHKAQHLKIVGKDCNSSEGIPISKWFYLLSVVDGKLVGCKEDIKNYDIVRLRLYGRVLAKAAGLYRENALIGKEESQNLTELIMKGELENVVIRSPLTCESKDGICQMCYGIDLGQGRPNTIKENRLIGLKENVGIIAAHSVSEPATQMALSKKHDTVQEQDQEKGKNKENLFNEARSFFDSNTEKIREYGDFIGMVDAIDNIYRKAKKDVSTIHFEVIIKAILYPHESILADASFKNEVKTLAKWAVEGRMDPIAGPKEKIMFGKHLHE